MKLKNKYDIVIVGAGLAGLNCAFNLEKNNIDYLLIEKSENVGGRLGSRLLNDFIIDEGFQVLLDSYEELDKTLDKKELEPRYFKQGALLRIEDNLVTFQSPISSIKAFISFIFESKISLNDKLQLASLSFYVLLNDSNTLLNTNELSSAEYIQKKFSKSLINSFFRPFLGGVFLDYELKTRTGFMFYIFKKFMFGKTFVPKDGMNTLPKKIAAKIPNEKLVLKTAVSKIGINSIFLENGEEIQANTIVIASNPGALNALGINEPKVVFNNSFTYYFTTEAKIPENLSKTLILNSKENEILRHFCVISTVSEAYAPNSKNLISVSIQNQDENELSTIEKIKTELNFWLEGEIKFLHKIEIPESLSLFENYSELDYKIKENVYRCGDYMRFPSTNAALKTGRELAELLLST
jgi:protoporphyrinogen oxidase